MLLKLLVLYVAVGGVTVVSASIRRVTAEEAWKAMNPGWNLGNTLDAIPDEGSWNNPKVLESTFDDIKKAKFKSVRIPVTWTDHFASQAPDYIVQEAWMDRVEQVVDWSLQRGFWTVLNVHHDSWQWADFTIDANTREERKVKFEKLWEQIAERFKNKSEKLILEPLNEPAGGSSKENADQYNDINQRFVDIVRKSGGNNSRRLLTLPGLNTNIQRTVDWFKEPKNVGNYILHIHDYDPWDFVSTSWGRTFWGSANDKQEIENTFIALQNRFAAPALIGEWGLTGSVERGASWIYFDFFVRTSTKYELASQLWDNGGDHFDRAARKWRDPIKLAIIQNAVKGIPNTLPAYQQDATLYFRANESAATRTVRLDYNGNKIRHIKLSDTLSTGPFLRRDRDFIESTTGVEITERYLSTLLQNPSAPDLGKIATLTIVSSRGADIELDIVRYETPEVGPEYRNITLPFREWGFLIPVDWKGTTLATIKAIKRDGQILKDDWTQWLGPLQQGRLNWGDFNMEGQQIVLNTELLRTIRNANQEVDLTLEFWPRQPGNDLTITIRVT